jgi:ATP-dependent Lon protease
MPRKHKMKEQPEIVQRFVKLVQKGNDNEEKSSHIDNDITYFKKLPEKQQHQIIEKMERKFSMDDETPPLKFRILEKQVPPNVEKVAMSKYNMLMSMEPSSGEYFKCYHWIEGYSQLPLGVYRDLPVRLEDGPEKCASFVNRVRECMDGAIYGHDEAKLQVLQFVSTWIANPKGAGNVLSIYGPMGVGKTTLVKEGVAKALERPFHFISLGGATDASYLDGHSYTYEGSTWGRIVDILMQSKCMNPIIYFDELDKVSETPKGEEIMNLLIHITDGSQNDKFQDKYFSGIDIDLSRCLFIFSHNNHERVNPILRDRMYNIKVNGFNLKEKLVIAEQYLINNALRNVGLHEKVSVSTEVIEYIIENHTGEEKGVRELKRCFETIMSKLNLLRFYNDPKMVPFAIKDFNLPFTLKKDHIGLFLKKNEEDRDGSFAHLYI